MSHITVSAEKVMKCCEAFIRISDARKAARIEDIISELAKVKGWNFKPYGIEKAKLMLESNDASLRYQIPYDIAKHVKSEKREIAEKLLILAKHGDPIIISYDHAFILEWGN